MTYWAPYINFSNCENFEDGMPPIFYSFDALCCSFSHKVVKCKISQELHWIKWIAPWGQSMPDHVRMLAVISTVIIPRVYHSTLAMTFCTNICLQHSTLYQDLKRQASISLTSFEGERFTMVSYSSWDLIGHSSSSLRNSNCKILTLCRILTKICSL